MKLLNRPNCPEKDRWRKTRIYLELIGFIKSGCLNLHFELVLLLRTLSRNKIYILKTILMAYVSHAFRQAGFSKWTNLVLTSPFAIFTKIFKWNFWNKNDDFRLRILKWHPFLLQQRLWYHQSKIWYILAHRDYRLSFCNLNFVLFTFNEFD